MTDVFISFAKEDYEIVKNLIANLKNEDLSVRTADDSTLPGADIAESLSVAIESAHFVLVVISQNSTSSEWILSEAAIAISKGKIVVPLIISSSEDIPFILRSFKAVYLNNPNSFSYDISKLAGYLKAAVPIPKNNPADSLLRLTNELAALNSEMLAYSFEQTHKNIRLIANAAAVAGFVALIITVFALLKDKIDFYGDWSSLGLGIAAGLVANFVVNEFKDKLLHLLTKHRGPSHE